jgi:hypothetical protein
MIEDYHTISWIFLSIAIGSQIEPIKFNEISMIADGINHSIPSEKEIRNSIIYLLKNEYIIKIEKKYSLTNKGLFLYNNSNSENKTLLKIWKEIQNKLINIK